MNRGPMFWIFLAVIAVVGVVVSRIEFPVSQEYDDLLRAQFHLPDDVEMVGIQHRGNRGWSPSLSGIAQFTPPQFDAYVDHLDDPAVWTLEPFEYKEVRVDGPVQGDALKWWDGSMAIITGPRALFWVGWGHIHGKPPDGGSDVWVEGPRRSLCFASMGEAYGNAVVPCNTLPDNGSRETMFAEGQHPELYVRGLVDLTERRVFMYIKSNRVKRGWF